eukprot:Gregarina_sp_Poly_1__946@NODE_1229_length_4718_cov_9_743066_g837_i0_p1_GENE_NODE_1229_length_4718_cov_9_743066_g837_i0NODE_1229_length_4718_cov_9_743066_g837_i0_p1_ORF_typecomplete_len1414_score154_74_NODE_1229_length_4718_cov_9_743066_g837_i03844625
METLSAMSTTDTAFAEKFSEEIFLSRKKFRIQRDDSVSGSFDGQSHICKLRPNHLDKIVISSASEKRPQERQGDDASSGTEFYKQSAKSKRATKRRVKSGIEFAYTKDEDSEQTDLEQGVIDPKIVSSRTGGRKGKVDKDKVRLQATFDVTYKARLERHRQQSSSQSQGEVSRNDQNNSHAPSKIRTERRQRERSIISRATRARRSGSTSSSSSRGRTKAGPKNVVIEVERAEHTVKEKMRKKQSKRPVASRRRDLCCCGRKSHDLSRQLKFRVHSSDNASSSSCDKSRESRRTEPSQPEARNQARARSLRPALRVQESRKMDQRNIKTGESCLPRESPRRNYPNVSFQIRYNTSKSESYTDYSSEGSCMPVRTGCRSRMMKLSEEEGFPRATAYRSKNCRDNKIFYLMGCREDNKNSAGGEWSEEELVNGVTDVLHQDPKFVHEYEAASFLGASTVCFRDSKAYHLQTLRGSEEQIRSRNMRGEIRPEDLKKEIRSAEGVQTTLYLGREPQSHNGSNNMPDGFSREVRQKLVQNCQVLQTDSTDSVDDWGIPTPDTAVSSTFHPVMAAISSTRWRCDPVILNAPTEFDCILFLLPDAALKQRILCINEKSVWSLINEKKFTEAYELAARGARLKQLKPIRAVSLEIMTLLRRWDFLGIRKVIRSQPRQIQVALQPESNVAQFMMNTRLTRDHIRANLYWWRCHLDRQENLFPNWLRDENEYWAARRLIDRIDAVAPPQEVASLAARDFRCCHLIKCWLIYWGYPIKEFVTFEREKSLINELRKGCGEGCPLSLAIACAEQKNLVPTNSQRMPAQTLLEAKRILNCCTNEESMANAYRALLGSAECGLYESAVEYCLTWKRSDLNTLQDVYEQTGMMASRYGWALAAGTDTDEANWATAIKVMSKDIENFNLEDRHTKSELVVVACRLLEQLSNPADDRDDAMTTPSQRSSLENAIRYLLDASQRRSFIACKKLSRILLFGEFGLPRVESISPQRSFYRSTWSEQFPITVNWDTLIDPFSCDFLDELNDMFQWERATSARCLFKDLRQRILDFYYLNKSDLGAEVLYLQLPRSETYKQPMQHGDNSNGPWSLMIKEVERSVKLGREACEDGKFPSMFEKFAGAFIQADVAVMMSTEEMLDILAKTELFRKKNFKDPRVVLVTCHFWLRLRRHPGTLTSKIRPKENQALAFRQEQGFFRERAALTELEGDLMSTLSYSNWAIRSWQEADEIFPEIRRKLKTLWEQFKMLLRKNLTTWDEVGYSRGMKPPFLDPAPMRRRLLDLLSHREVSCEGSPFRRDLLVILAFITLRRVPLRETREWIKQAVQAENECTHLLHTKTPEEYLVLVELDKDPTLLKQRYWRHLIKGRLAGKIMERTLLSCSALLYRNIHPLLLEVGAEDMAVDYFSRRGVAFT